MVKRFATILGAMLLATSTLAVPAQALPPPTFTCESGGVREDGFGALRVHGSTCGGIWTGAADAEVVLKSGPDAGKYFCEFVFFFTTSSGVLGMTCHRL
ncbi:hypothetical protein ACFWY5_45060 [Nonomuraea sp. NPDC059007]|uniref:hypothetical protein n=1 Tax=Nonomuraea sp. NPDC059007 TaxID=3346692 RepID=UPI0036773F71